MFWQHLHGIIMCTPPDRTSAANKRGLGEAEGKRRRPASPLVGRRPLTRASPSEKHRTQVNEAHVRRGSTSPRSREAPSRAPSALLSVRHADQHHVRHRAASSPGLGPWEGATRSPPRVARASGCTGVHPAVSGLDCATFDGRNVLHLRPGMTGTSSPFLSMIKSMWNLAFIIFVKAGALGVVLEGLVARGDVAHVIAHRQRDWRAGAPGAEQIRGFKVDETMADSC